MTDRTTDAVPDMLAIVEFDGVWCPAIIEAEGHPRDDIRGVGQSECAEPARVREVVGGEIGHGRPE